MYNWWIARSPRLLRLLFFRRFLLWLLRLFRPGRHDPTQAPVGHGLAEMLAKMSRNHEEGSAQGGLTVEHLLRFVGIGVVEGGDDIAKMREGILHSLKDFRFVPREPRDGLEIEACRRGGPQCPGKAAICPRNGGGELAARCRA